MASKSSRPHPRPSALGGVAPLRVTDQIGFLLRLASQRATANLVARISKYDVTVGQANVLARLHEHGGVSQNRLGRMVAMEPPNVRDVVRRLESRKLITQSPDLEDKRLIVFRLTDAGRSLIQKLIPLSKEGLADTLAPLSAREREVLRRLLRRIARI